MQASDSSGGEALRRAPGGPPAGTTGPLGPASVVTAAIEAAGGPQDGGVTVFDLGRPLFAGMPQSPNHPEFRMALQRRHGDMVRADGSSAANEIVVTGGHVGTHIDALCHVSFRGMLHGGIEAAAAQSGGRFGQLGIETVAPIVRPGLLLDIPLALGLPALPAAYEITPQDLDAAMGLAGAEPAPGAVLLVRSGWGMRFGDRDSYIGAATGVPGVGEPGARWLSEHGPVAVGADTIAFERLAPGQGHALLPAHRHLLVDAGVYIIEAMDLEGLAGAGVREFLFVASPLKLVGATGSPIRPLAITVQRTPAQQTPAQRATVPQAADGAAR
jgi:kynurenine formamidase